MGVAFGKQNQDQLLQKERIANEKIQILERENEELRGLFLKEKTKNTKFQTFAICSSIYFILSLLSFWGIWLSWPVDVEVNVPCLENTIPNCSSDTSCVSPSPIIAEPPASQSPIIAEPPASQSPIIAEPPASLYPIIAELPASLSPIVVQPTVSVPTVSKPTYIKELDSDEDPWHLICHLYWVVLFQNSGHYSDKNRSSVFEFAAARLLENHKKDKMVENLRFGRRNCAKFPSKCKSSKDAYVRIYHNGHYLDYEFPDSLSAATGATTTAGDSTGAKIRADACAGGKKADAGAGAADLTPEGVFPAGTGIHIADVGTNASVDVGADRTAEGVFPAGTGIHIADVGTNASADAGAGAHTASTAADTTADVAAAADAHIDSLVAWIRALVEFATLYNRGSGISELVPDGQNYCVNEVSHFPINNPGSWVVHCYNTSSPHHSNVSSLLVSAAHDFVHTGDLRFAQLDCTHYGHGHGHRTPVPTAVYPGIVNRVTPYILFYDWKTGYGSEYFCAEAGTHTHADLVVWIRACLRHRRRLVWDF